MADTLSLRDRRAVLDRLGQIAAELGQIATWLGMLDQDHAAVRAECAARDLEAACWQLETPIRLRLSVSVNGQLPPLGG